MNYIQNTPFAIPSFESSLEVLQYLVYNEKVLYSKRVPDRTFL